ncbi:hypothetical protein JCM10207_002057 [Rhodosporidiobolus poonsookiae]
MYLVFDAILTGVAFNLENLTGSETVDDLKQRIEKKTTIPRAEQNLIWGGRVLEDGTALPAYDNLGSGARIQFIQNRQ